MLETIVIVVYAVFCIFGIAFLISALIALSAIAGVLLFKLIDVCSEALTGRERQRNGGEP